MARTDPLQVALQALADLRLKPQSPAVTQTIRKALSSKYNLVVAKAARLCLDRELTELAPDLARAWPRHCKNLPKNDKNCKAKFAIVDVLYRLEEDYTELFLQGFGHVQLEGSFGPPVDTAAMLRGRSLQALIANRHPEAARMTVQLLFDPWMEARSGAIRAATALPEGELLLRMKCLAGDEEPAVLGECFSGLLNLAPLENQSFVAGYLNHKDSDLVILAALALGESKDPGALPLLQDAWLQLPQLRKDLVLPIALLRLDAAFDFLIRQAKEAPFSRDMHTLLEQSGCPQPWLDKLPAQP